MSDKSFKQKVKEKVPNVSGKLWHLKSAGYETLKNQTRDVNAQVETIGTQARDMNAQMESIENQIRDMTQLLNGLKKQARNMTKQMDSIESQARDIDTRVDSIEDQAFDIATRIDKIEDLLSNLCVRIEGMEILGNQIQVSGFYNLRGRALRYVQALTIKDQHDQVLASFDPHEGEANGDDFTVPFLFTEVFPDTYQLISFEMTLDTGEVFTPSIRYPRKAPYCIVRENMFAWGIEGNIYCDYFVGDYGQSLAIRYLREQIEKTGADTSGCLTVSDGATKPIGEISRDAALISEFLDATYVECQEIPVDIRNGILCYINAAFAKSENLMGAYQPEIGDLSEEWEMIRGLLLRLDDSVLLKMSANRYTKAFLFHVKYDRNCDLIQPDPEVPELQMFYDELALYRISTFDTIIFRVEISNDNVQIEGGLHFPAGVDVDRIVLTAFANDKEIPVTRLEDMSDKYRYDKKYLHEVGFCIDTGRIERQTRIKFGYYYEDVLIMVKKFTYQNLTSPITNEIKNGFVFDKNIIVQTAGNEILCGRCTSEQIGFRENMLRKEIQGDKTLSRQEIRETSFIRTFYRLARYGFDETLYHDLLERLESWRYELKDFDTLQDLVYRYASADAPNRGKTVWLMMDRPDRADDNGEAYFRYMRKIDPENIDCYFLLQEEAGNYEELSRIGCVVEPLSLSHCILHSIAECVISSQMQEFVMNPYNKRQKYLHDLEKNPGIIFLQHGVIHNHHGKLMGRYGRDFRGFITSGYPEYEYIKSTHFHYTEREVWLTGLSRFDRLYHDEKRMITIMPTWRKWLTHRGFDENINSLAWIINDGFEETEYFKFYEGLINDERLLAAAEKYHYQIAFLPHVNFLHLSGMFRHPEEVKVYDYEEPYRKVFAESSLVITDYTSAVFDFAYLHKPIVYCQFDKEEFYGRHTVNKGYFDFERDGFGEVTYDRESCVDAIISYMENDCELKQVYRDRIDAFFPFFDRNCCERLYHHLLEITAE